MSLRESLSSFFFDVRNIEILSMAKVNFSGTFCKKSVNITFHAFMGIFIEAAFNIAAKKGHAFVMK